MEKYGFDNFDWFIVFKGQNKEEIVSKEIFFIDLFKSNIKSIGYNLTLGGEGVTMTEEIRRKIGIANSGKFGNLNPFFGKTHSEETKEHFSNIRKGIRCSPFVKHSEETKERLSVKRKLWASDQKNKKKLSLQNQFRRPLFCIELAKNFDSIKEASEFINVPYSTFKKYLNLNKPINNYTFIDAKDNT